MEPIIGSIIAACITGGLALVGVIISNMTTHRGIEEQLKVSQAITDTKIESLTVEVRKHNNFAERIPVMENDIKNIKDDINGVGKRIGRLEECRKAQKFD